MAEVDPGPDGPVVKYGKKFYRHKGKLTSMEKFAEGTMAGGASTVKKLRTQGGVLSETLRKMKPGKY